jgi:hypothetical protein
MVTGLTHCPSKTVNGRIKPRSGPASPSSVILVESQLDLAVLELGEGHLRPNRTTREQAEISSVARPPVENPFELVSSN